MGKRFAGLALIAAALLWAAPTALANAPNPIQGTTTVDSVVTNTDGSHTVTVQGQWLWVYTNEPNCPADKDGVGYNVAWFDGNTANPMGGSTSPDGVIYVGDTQDNIVHSLNDLNPSNTDAAFNGVPLSYLSHNTTSRTPTTTDAANWISNCGTNGATGATGTWGPIAHTYPASVTNIRLCPVVYDPHGRSQNSGGGKENVRDITAGGGSHNMDNSYEGNGTGANGDNCLLTTVTIPPPSTPTTTPTPTKPAPSGTTKAVCTVSTSTVHLSGATGSKTKTFTVSVGSFAVKEVRFYVDGHLVATVKKSSHGKFSTQIDPAKYGFGAHHVTAKVTFSAPNCAGVVRHATFVHPKSAVVSPKFTG